MDDDLKKAHGHSSRHALELKRSEVCGCFYCLRVFNAQEIKSWVDDDQTAICPFCGIDSVLGSACGFPIDPQFLERMMLAWF